MAEKIDFGTNIKKVRLKHQLTQAQFGEIIGKSASTVHGYENNTVVPPFDVLLTISELFDVTVGALMGFRDIKEPTANIQAWRDIYDEYIKLLGDDQNE